ncbi:MAG: hypothetical protein JWP27_1388 [Flaviaesturariibacter sp.]|nr:hypothetical protein [Flaviaesturariibacter sp.]
MTTRLTKQVRYWLFTGLALIAFLFLFLVVVAERYVVPQLKARISAFVVSGSDSLYTCSIGSLDASFLGGNVEISGLHIGVDSVRYRSLQAAGRLPSLTMKFDMEHGHMQGVRVLPLVFGKKIDVREVFSKDARVILQRNRRRDTSVLASVPLWKAMQPDVSRILIGQVRLDNLRFLYTTEDGDRSVKIQFDTCNALIRRIRIDSVAAADTDRIGFARDVTLHFYDLKFRSADSSYKLKAKVIDYSSTDRSLVVQDFKLQPTLKEKDAFYAAAKSRKSMTVIEYDKIAFTNFKVETFLNHNAIEADSVLVNAPKISIYVDKTYPPMLAGKVGQYPHQQLMRAGALIRIKGIGIRNLSLAYTERGEKNGQEGTLTLDGINLQVGNVTNDPALIRRNNLCVATATGRLLGQSPLEMRFVFPLDSTEGQFSASGTIRHVTAAQLNALAPALANTRLQSLDMHELRFALHGDDYSATGDVRMRYDNLFVVLQKTDERTGTVSTKKLLTKILNRFTLQSSNPANGTERVATGVVRSRQMTEPFFALLWNTVYTGMQGIMTGH